MDPNVFPSDKIPVLQCEASVLLVVVVDENLHRVDDSFCHLYPTEYRLKAVPRFRELCFLLLLTSSYLPFLGLACRIQATWGPPFHPFPVLKHCSISTCRECFEVAATSVISHSSNDMELRQSLLFLAGLFVNDASSGEPYLFLMKKNNLNCDITYASAGTYLGCYHHQYNSDLLSNTKQWIGNSNSPQK